MAKYRVHFSALPYEPFPLLDTLAVIDADDPISAVEKLLAEGRVPTDRVMRWARVVLEVYKSSQPTKVVRVPIEIDRDGKVWSRRKAD